MFYYPFFKSLVGDEGYKVQRNEYLEDEPNYKRRKIILNFPDLPREILTHILKFYMKTETQVSLMRDVANVNKAFENACFDPGLWETVDARLSDSTMMKLIKRGSLSLTKSVAFRGIEELNEKNASFIFESLRNVTDLDLSPVKKFSGDFLKAVAENCTNLSNVRFGKPQLPLEQHIRAERKIHHRPLRSFLSVKGSYLSCLDISHCDVQGMAHVLHSIADCCSNLEELSITAIDEMSVFPTRCMQTKCRKLRVLSLDQTCTPSRDRYFQGFPDLTSFSFHDRDGDALGSAEFSSVLFNSSKLQSLNLINCNVSYSSLLRLPVNGIERLTMPTRSMQSSSNALRALFLKWLPTLKELDLSQCKESVIHALLRSLPWIPHRPLEILNLNETDVLTHHVHIILALCRELHTVHLSSCSFVSEEIRRVFWGAGELVVLKEYIGNLYKS